LILREFYLIQCPRAFACACPAGERRKRGKNFTDYFSRILASICGICVFSEEKLLYGQLPAPSCGQALKNCNKFTIVGRREAVSVKREAERLIELITSWIITAFSAFAPKMQGGWMGTALSGSNSRAFPSYFLPNPRNFFSFLPRPTTCDLRPTASLGAGAKTQAFVRAPPGSARAGIGFVRAAPGSVRVSPVSVRIAQGSVPIFQKASSSRFPAGW
jgi:hypothetical protein